MSELRANVKTATWKLGAFQGLNRSAPAGSGLESGEAMDMANFRVTDEGALATRPGTRALCALTAQSVLTEGENTVIATERNRSTVTFTAYPAAQPGADGGVSLWGEARSVSAENAGSCGGLYVKNGLDAYRLTALSLHPEGETQGAIKTPGGYVRILTGTGVIPRFCQWEERWEAGEGRFYFRLYPGVRVEEGQVIPDGEPVEVYRHDMAYTRSIPAEYVGYYALAYGSDDTAYYPRQRVFRVSGQSIDSRFYFSGDEAVFAADDVYTWTARPVQVGAAGEKRAVQGLWQGRVGEREWLCAACGGHLWALEKNAADGFDKIDLGSVDTTGRVGLFGFGGKLYVLDGQEYRVWDGSSLLAVEGYVPCVAVACAPDGNGQNYEQANLLTLRRRRRYEADGEAVCYALGERWVQSVERVSVGGNPCTLYTAQTAAGTVRFNTPPARGTQVEIWYSVSLAVWEDFAGDGANCVFTLSTYAKDVAAVTGATVNGAAAAFQAQGNRIRFTAPPPAGAAVQVRFTQVDPRRKVTGMRLAEFFNGGTDSRVFLYGDGSCEAVYSGVTEAAVADAAYFPDLNAMAVGQSNSPLTALLRHYDRMLAFKPGECFSVRYDTLTLSDGSLTAGFYLTPVNRSVGCALPGQAVLAENAPRTLDGGGVYEWSAPGGGNIGADARNARRVSEKVEAVLSLTPPEDLLCAYDDRRAEYYLFWQGGALVQNLRNDAWYCYEDLDVCAVLCAGAGVYLGTGDGRLLRLERDLTTDCGAPISARWVSGELALGSDYRRKYSPILFLSLKPQTGGGVTVELGEPGSAPRVRVNAPNDAQRPRVERLRLKGRKMNYYRLCLHTTTPVTVLGAEVRVKYTGDVM